MAQATRAHPVETSQARAALVRHAGMGRISLGSVIAGTLVAYGAFAVLLAVAAAVAEAVGFDTDLTTQEWRGLGAAGGAVVAGLLFGCYLYGGYVAGRMARRAGAMNGAMVFVVGLLVALGVAGLVNVFTDGDQILRELRDVGVPTSSGEWRDIGTVAGAGSLLAMLAGSLLGGVLGERWHTKLLARAANPTYGPEAEEREAVERHRQELRKAQERAAERHDEADDGVRQAAAPTAVPAGWYDESSAAERRFATVPRDSEEAPGDTGTDDEEGDGARRRPRHRIRAGR